MNIQDILSSNLTLSEQIDIVKSVNSYQKNEKTPYYIEQYEGKHNILSKPNKTRNGKVITYNKLVFNYQKLIANLAASFILGTPINLELRNITPENSELFAQFKKLWKAANTDNFLYLLTKTTLIETRCAIKTLKNSSKGIKHQLIKYDNSVDFCVNYNDSDEIDSFIHTFELTNFNTVSNELEEIQVIDFITPEKRFLFNATNETEFKTPEKIDNLIPVVYSHVKNAEFADVQTLIDRLEEILSRNSDSNDYFSEPKLYTNGILSLYGDAEKGQAGDIIQVTGGIEGGNPELKYLTWERASESFKFEVENLLQHIFSLSQTPQIDFNSLKSIGNLSGLALELMFLGTTIKSKDHIQTTFNKVVTDLIEIIKNQLTFNEAIQGNFNQLDIGFEFNDGLPVNEKELIETLTIAVNGGILSKETASEYNPYVNDASKEIEQIKNESIQDAFI